MSENKSSQENNNDFHSKWRPKDLDEVIGHEAAVTRLRGQIKTGKLRSAYLFTGPSSVGKTTLARCLAAAINGKPADQQTSDYKEMNAGDQKSIDDMRELIRLSKFKPSGKKRIFMIDEAQALLTNNAAATAILKPLEDAGKTDTIWVIGSMDPAKFTSGAGKAIANRCDQFALSPPSIEAMTAFAKRIVIGEDLRYLKSSALLTKVAEASNQEFRNVANILQSMRDYYEGLKKKPEKLSEEDINTVLQSAESADDRLVVPVVVGALTGQYKMVHRALMDVADPFLFVKKLSWAANFLVSIQVVDRHPKLWWSPTNKAIVAGLKGKTISLGHYAAFNEIIVNCQQQASTFTVGACEILSARIFRFIKDSAK
jgi:DNA polymerase III delta prime subunit